MSVSQGGGVDEDLHQGRHRGSATGAQAQDVLVDGERIVVLLEPGTSVFGEIDCRPVIDATGRYVVPGGIDAHTHMELPFGGTCA